jgi:hypothetical protein
VDDRPITVKLAFESPDWYSVSERASAEPVALGREFHDISRLIDSEFL